MSLPSFFRFALLGMIALVSPLALAQPTPAELIFQNVIEGPPLPISRIGPDSQLLTKGFALYREGNGDYTQFRKLVCDLGVSEIYVLSGNGHVETEYNQRLALEPESQPCLRGNKKVGLVVKYGLDPSEGQLVRDPLDTAFLKKFDQWVLAAKRTGKKIAFRCNCGCHRTARLAGYSEMRFFGRSPDQAFKSMDAAIEIGAEGVRGKFFARLWKRGTIRQQIYALYDYIYGQPCTTRAEYCVKQVAEERTAGVAVAKDPAVDFASE